MLVNEENIGTAINKAMKSVETENEELKGVLPKTYTKIHNAILVSALKTFSQIAVDADGEQKPASPKNPLHLFTNGSRPLGPNPGPSNEWLRRECVTR